jgi:2-polyprenyl-3-methyl-5-hydroxy-6-metoxy-1,4-benzoquinol methylase
MSFHPIFSVLEDCRVAKMESVLRSVLGKATMCDYDSRSSATIARPEWTEQAVERFWHFHSESVASQELSFSRRVGEGIANFLSSAGCVRSGAKVLDFGCGVGFLAPYLMARGLRYHGCDRNLSLLKRARELYEKEASWAEVTQYSTNYPDAYFDIVTCVEVLEHVWDKELVVTVQEVFRLTKPGGVALFTVPNAENLDRAQTYCPFCNSAFHYRQHLRSLDADLLASLIRKAGFQVRFCEALSFSRLCGGRRSWKDLTIRDLAHWVRQLRDSCLDRMEGRQGISSLVFRKKAGCGLKSPHLCVLGERPPHPGLR